MLNSKTLKILDHDVSLNHPTWTILALLRWKIWRFKEGNFHLSHPERQAWHEKQVERLRADILKLPRRRKPYNFMCV